MQNVTIGRIVQFFPGTQKDKQLPNSMGSAPAIVTQVFGEHVNLTVFTANPSGDSVRQEWSVLHKSSAYLSDGMHYWDWFPKVATPQETVFGAAAQ